MADLKLKDQRYLAALAETRHFGQAAAAAAACCEQLARHSGIGRAA